MINLIVAHGMNNEIGYENELLWKLPKDMKRFKDITTGHTVVMGRKTYESIGKLLPNRHNIILSKQPWLLADVPALVTDSLETILRLKPDREIFIIGGAEVYKAFLPPYADRLYITLVRGQFKADTFFPEYHYLLENYKIIEDTEHDADENNQFAMRFLTYEKINKKA
jgi:dihydrofolate reductase